MARRKRKPPRTDPGPPERYLHGDTIVQEPSETAGMPRRKVVTHSVLARYLHRGEITLPQYAAGDRLFKLWARAGGPQNTTPRYDGTTGGGNGQISDAQAEARSEYAAAMKAVGQQLSPIVVHVCLMDMPARDWAMAVGKHERSGIEILRMALDALADHWRRA